VKEKPLFPPQNRRKHLPIPLDFLRALAPREDALKSAASPCSHARRFVFAASLSLKVERFAARSMLVDFGLFFIGRKKVAT